MIRLAELRATDEAPRSPPTGEPTQARLTGRAGRAPGIYRWTSDVLAETAAAALRARGRAVWVVHAEVAWSKTLFLDACAQGLALPSWFGRNWDALADALADLAVPTSGGVVLLSGMGALATADPVALATAVEVFAGALDRSGGGPLWILVSGLDDTAQAGVGDTAGAGLSAL